MAMLYTQEELAFGEIQHIEKGQVKTVIGAPAIVIFCKIIYFSMTRQLSQNFLYLCLKASLLIRFSNFFSNNLPFSDVNLCSYS